MNCYSLFSNLPLEKCNNFFLTLSLLSLLTFGDFPPKYLVNKNLVSFVWVVFVSLISKTVYRTLSTNKINWNCGSAVTQQTVSFQIKKKKTGKTTKGKRISIKSGTLRDFFYFFNMVRPIFFPHFEVSKIP